MFKTIARLIRHRWLDHTDAARAVPPQLAEQLRRRVHASEQRHSGEVRICVEGGLPTSYLWRHLRDGVAMPDIVRQRVCILSSLSVSCCVPSNLSVAMTPPPTPPHQGGEFLKF